MPSNVLTSVLIAAALLVMAVAAPAVRAEGERPSDPDTLTFYNGGRVTGGRKENLESVDNRMLRLSDTLTVSGSHGDTIRVAPDDSVEAGGFDVWHGFPNSGDCFDAPFGTNLFGCVDEPWGASDNYTTYAYTSSNLNMSVEFLFPPVPPPPLPDEALVSALFQWRESLSSPGGETIVASFILNDCGFSTFGDSPPPIFTNYEANISWPASPCPGGPYDTTLELKYYCDSNPCDQLYVTTVSVLYYFESPPEARTLGAELSVPSRSEYPVRAEWTCSEDEDNGPYYIGARNATATRWFGELCPSGAGDYNATMTSEDMIDGRVYFRIADNATDDPTGYLTGNVTLDRLVAILTADFQVSVANLGWLLYLAFMTVGILVAVWAFYLWRERE